VERDARHDRLGLRMPLDSRRGKARLRRYERSGPKEAAGACAEIDIAAPIRSPVGMPLHLQRASVIDQVAAAVRQGIARGEWEEWLPGERRLCTDLDVGRNTLRGALRQLAQEGLIVPVSGRGSRILGTKATRREQGEWVVGLLSPEPMDRLRPHQALWIDELRGRLAEGGSLLKMIHGPQYFRPSPRAALERLVQQEKCGCWILVLSNKACQQWFERRRLPCVIAGSCHEGITLPFVDLDYRALCRHAATTLLRLGHRRLALLTHVPEAAGDMMSEAGFLEGVRSGGTGAEGAVVHHGAARAAIVDCVRRLIEAPRPPTAIVVSNSYLYLTVFSVLLRLGCRVPEDVSLISRDSDTFLFHLNPAPACYVEDPHLFARKLARITEKLRNEVPAQPPQVKLIPRLVAGGSVCRRA
jgi:DNA-binding LacI/PurR family transcriptional regulator